MCSQLRKKVDCSAIESFLISWENLSANPDLTGIGKGWITAGVYGFTACSVPV
jgi:hypothetical protein